MHCFCGIDHCSYCSQQYLCPANAAICSIDSLQPHSYKKVSKWGEPARPSNIDVAYILSYFITVCGIMFTLCLHESIIWVIMISLATYLI